MLNNRANKLVSNTSHIIKRLNVIGFNHNFVSSAESYFLSCVDRLAWYTARSEDWKQAWGELVELNRECYSKMEGGDALFFGKFVYVEER